MLEKLFEKVFRKRPVVVAIVIAAIGMLLWTDYTMNQQRKKAFELKIESVSPVSGAMDVSLYPTMDLNFSRRVSADEVREIQFTSSPKITGVRQLSKDGKTLSLVSSDALEANKQYTVQITYREKPFISWSFTTISEDKIKQLTQQGDEKFAKAEQEIKNKYPFLDKLPLQTKLYFVYFDTNKNSFVAKIYPRSSTSTSVDTQTQQAKDEIVSKLKLIVPDAAAKYSIEWVIIPQS